MYKCCSGFCLRVINVIIFFFFFFFLVSTSICFQSFVYLTVFNYQICTKRNWNYISLTWLIDFSIFRILIIASKSTTEQCKKYRQKHKGVYREKHAFRKNYCQKMKANSIASKEKLRVQREKKNIGSESKKV